METKLPAEFRTLVRDSLNFLGKAIESEYGKDTLTYIEHIRLEFKNVREAGISEKLKLHEKILTSLRKLTPKKRFWVAHSFAVSLELINACENAYRTFRLRKSPEKNPAQCVSNITFVLTAHPTESRSPECILIFSQITNALINILDGNSEALAQLEHLILLAIKVPMARDKKPEVADEAAYIYSVLREDIINVLSRYASNNQPVYLSTWVGGDKDGHPGVTAKVMTESFSLSRERLIETALSYVDRTQNDLSIIHAKLKSLTALSNHLRQLKNLNPGDGKKITTLYALLTKAKKQYSTLVRSDSPGLKELSRLLDLFPALVVPLELRESSDLVQIAAEKSTGEIFKMFTQVNKLSRGANPRWYVKGFVVSMTESPKDILAGLSIVKKTLGKPVIPVIPLFENKKALNLAIEITSQTLKNKELHLACTKFWNSTFEIMLGYSDSAKENGALSSRTMIGHALHELEKTVQGFGLMPVFFHGSGGSVDRGGGSVEDQVAWWPDSARSNFKATIQGEMIYRTFASSEILNSIVQKIVNCGYKEAKHPSTLTTQSLISFSNQVAEHYRKLIHDPNFLQIVEKATPYSYLDQLKIGSRPTKRAGQLSVKGLRAIPWVLCWTQTRILLPVWWGVGSAWENLNKEEQVLLKETFKSHPLFKTFVKLMAFTLSKVDLSVAFSYLMNSSLDKKLIDSSIIEISKEHEKAMRFVRALSGEQNLLWYRPWLGTSIRLRSTMIHPMNLLQIIALKDKDPSLLRETVTGIASGMLTTG
ncbi:MAG: phosphoenolpyruvate carboxylase [Oligoflexia bacterium]|nr:phosphoenolpyruvate carboxylase [Oligoflexia bacterium]